MALCRCTVVYDGRLSNCSVYMLNCGVQSPCKEAESKKKRLVSGTFQQLCESQQRKEPATLKHKTHMRKGLG